MHVLSGLGHRRKSSKTRDLHIRKVSFSGCSLASGCSFESNSSTSTSRPTLHTRCGSSGSNGSFDPLRSHPIHQAPPRLSDRPIIRPISRPQTEPLTTFYNDEESEDEYRGYPISVFDEDDTDDDFESVYADSTMDMPALTSPSEHSNDESDDEPSEYFFLDFAKRPQLPRSRWSESTIQTINQLTPAISNVDSPLYIEQAIAVPLPQKFPNFSYKRNTVPRRPSIHASDSVEDLIKRGGWKRRGIVFHNEDVASCDGTEAGIAA